MILLAFKVRKLLNIRQKPPDHITMNRGYIHCYLHLTANNLTMLYPNTECCKSLRQLRTTWVLNTNFFVSDSILYRYFIRCN